MGSILYSLYLSTPIKNVDILRNDIMAELLILNRDHWMNTLTQKQIDEYVANYGAKWLDKYNARAEKGDVVDIKEDGHWTGVGRGYDKDHFDVVVVKGKTVQELEYLRGSLIEVKEQYIYDIELMEGRFEPYDFVHKKFKSNISTWVDKEEINLTSVVQKVIT